MSVAKLTKKLNSLHEYESEKGSFESDAIKLISLSKTSLDQQKVEDLTTLIDSVKPLRKLLHRQVKELLLELQTQMKISKNQRKTDHVDELQKPSHEDLKKSESLSDDEIKAAQTPHHAKVGESQTPHHERIDDTQTPSYDGLAETQTPGYDGLAETQTPSYDALDETYPPNSPVNEPILKAIEPIIKAPKLSAEQSNQSLTPAHHLSKSTNAFAPRFEPSIQTPPPLILTQVPIENDSKSVNLSQDAQANPDQKAWQEDAKDEFNELENLKRGVECLTAPDSEDDVIPNGLIPTLQSSAELPFEFSPLPTLDPSFFNESSSPSEPTPLSPESSAHNLESESESDSESNQVPVFEFPISAGEAGTAVFGEEDLKRYRDAERKHAEKDERQDNKSVTALFSVHVSTPHQVFTGHAEEFNLKELALISQQNLMRGEEVNLKFKLPQSQKEIECKALVRSIEDRPNEQKRLLLRFLDLRPAQEYKIKAEIS